MNELRDIITLWYVWRNGTEKLEPRWEYHSWELGWNANTRPSKIDKADRARRWAKEYGYLLENKIIYNVE